MAYTDQDRAILCGEGLRLLRETPTPGMEETRADMRAALHGFVQSTDDVVVKIARAALAADDEDREA